MFYELKANVADDWYEFFMESGVADSMLGRWIALKKLLNTKHDKMNNGNSMQNKNNYVLQVDVFVDDTFLGFSYSLTILYSSRAVSYVKNKHYKNHFW